MRMYAASLFCSRIRTSPLLLSMPGGVGPLQAGGYTAPFWLLACLHIADHFLVQKRGAPTVVAYPADEGTKLEFATCRGELLGALTCPVAASDEDREVQKVSSEERLIHQIFEAVGVLSSVLGFLSVVVARLRADCCEFRRHVEPAAAEQDRREVPPARRRRVGGAGIVV